MGEEWERERGSEKFGRHVERGVFFGGEGMFLVSGAFLERGVLVIR